MAADIEEKNDLTAGEPERVKSMLARWNAWNASHPPVGPRFLNEPSE
jgi:hypothetical protein